MARSIKHVLRNTRSADLLADEVDDFIDQVNRSTLRRAMLTSQIASVKAIRESKPIGKKHYRKTIRRDNVLYVATGQIDDKGMMTYSPIDTDSI